MDNFEIMKPTSWGSTHGHLSPSLQGSQSKALNWLEEGINSPHADTPLSNVQRTHPELKAFSLHCIP